MDETKRIEACLALKDNLEAVFNSVHDGIIVLDSHMKVININEAALGFFGVSKQEALGKSCFCDEMLVDIKDILQETVREKKPIKNYSFKFIDHTGDERTVIMSTAILRDSAGEEGGVMLIIHDISEIRKLQTRLESHPSYFKLIGRNRKMQEVYTLIDKVAKAEAPVLIEGESGVGKGLVAEAIHKKSGRRDEPFIKVNCAALSETLLESELFGHVKGAFTGAYRDRIGRFELAHGGTIFLDEIGEIPPSTQVKLLTVLQDKLIERVGDTQQRNVDVRIISATNQNLKELVEKKLFREDLYYRLKVVRLNLPSLRERIDDLTLLADHFIEKQRNETGKPIKGISREAMKAMARYRWPGNIRELENAIAQAFVLCEGGLIEPEDLPEEILRTTAYPGKPPATPLTDLPGDEPARIKEALEITAGQKSKAAKMLGINRTTLWRKIKTLNIH
ncbi:MAG: sigma 54-interacting transcriptional regulator [Nitrospinae bacterium]|nr:sigma 54-interacting transcriptional regulator [Nitrospinota bacterium]